MALLECCAAVTGLAYEVPLCFESESHEVAQVRVVVDDEHDGASGLRSGLTHDGPSCCVTITGGDRIHARGWRALDAWWLDGIGPDARAGPADVHSGGNVAVELRRNDYSLSDEQVQLVDMLRSMLAQHSPMSTVRDAEPLGFDQALWDVVRGNGLLTIAIPESIGGDGGGLVELALTGIEIGRAAAPVPLLDHVAALRTLGALVADGQSIGSLDWEAALAGDTLVSLAPISTWELGAELVPSGAVAGAVLAFKGGDLVLMSRTGRAPQASNEGCAPVAWWSPDDAEVTVEVLATGTRAVTLWDRARREWRIATAASLVGILEASGEIARNYALERQAFGVTIAKFQAISHDLVNIHMDELTSRNMTLKAAWLTEFEPDFRPELAAMAMAQATRSALRSTSKAVHVHGGMGITLEADISLYYRKASAWSLVGGGVHRDLQEIGREIDRRAAARAAAAPTLASTNR
jgi:hypothetical protein